MLLNSLNIHYARIHVYAVYFTGKPNLILPVLPSPFRCHTAHEAGFVGGGVGVEIRTAAEDHCPSQNQTSIPSFREYSQKVHQHRFEVANGISVLVVFDPSEEN